jgi:SAM-dependent methyltransferase
VRPAVKAVLTVRIRRTLRSLRLHAWSVADRISGGKLVRGYGGLIGGGDFDAVGREFLGHFQRLGGLRPEDHVLDIGCGLGRMVPPVAAYLTIGEYRGFDVVEPAIRSCRRRYASLPAFRFEHVDVFNGKYNPKGRIAPADFVFPYPDATFDFAFATSVFTHMLHADVETYLRETARVLRPGGRLLATWFVMTPEANVLVEQRRSHVGFPVHRGDVWYSDPREPEAAVAYGPGSVHRFHEAAGLTVAEPIHRGTWSGLAGVSYQDIVVARRLVGSDTSGTEG